MIFTLTLLALLALPASLAARQAKREPHLPVLTLPTQGEEIYVMVDSGVSTVPGYFEFPVVMVDGEGVGLFARVMLQNSTGEYQVGAKFHVYNSWTYQSIVNSTLSIIAPGEYNVLIQENLTDTTWTTTVSAENVTVYSEICGTDPTCCWSCTT